MKDRVKRIVASALSSEIAAPLLGGFFARRLNMVFYHGVWPAGSEALRLFGGIDVEKFRSDLELLSRRFRFVTFEKAMRLNSSGERLDKPAICLTFDDCLTVEHCRDILDEFGIRAAMFVTEACVDNAHLMWVHKLTAILAEKGEQAFVRVYNETVSRRGAGPSISGMCDFPFCAVPWRPAEKDGLVDDMWERAGMPPLASFLARHRPYMTHDDLKDWIEQGHTVGLHTLTHPFCSELTEDDLDAEFVQPARRLRETLGLGELPFAYPFGRRLPAHLEHEAMSRAGLACMLGTAGISRLGTNPIAINRAHTEFDLPRHLYFETIKDAVRGRSPN
jgi:peptidoglycan/xylan/chitin deacetylase (PgdA/CDA1 family)